MERRIVLKRRFNPHHLPPWLKTIRGLGAQFIIPFCVFQGVRTFLLPSAFDLFLLVILLIIALAYRLELI
ncbi:hypothetical protein M3606_17665 [Cytobacillus horneckiae]|nr:hypothetical protein [Cytobacillus horneckiae]MCM3179703.1 hypothetical protein [Cytobacillus horneckiae]